MSDDRHIVSLGDLPVAEPVSGTDTLALCQNPAGCGETDTLSQVTLTEIADYVLSEIPLPQYISEIVPSVQRVALSNNSPTTVAVLQVPPGEWLLTGEVWFELLSGNASNVNRLVAMIGPNTTAPSEPADDISVSVGATANVGVGVVLPLGNVYVSNTGTTPVPYYLTANAVWTSNVSMAAFGKIAGSTI